MIKNAFYFKHDNNARNHPKILQLRAEFGLLAYAIYFCLLEILDESETGLINTKFINGVALNLGLEEKILKDFLDRSVEIGLFKINKDGFISSKRIMEEKEKRTKLSEAGKRGAQAKKDKKQKGKKTTTVKPPLSHPKAPLKLGEERRGEERKEKRKNIKKEKEPEVKNQTQCEQLLNYIDENLKQVKKIERGLSLSEADKLISIYGHDKTKETLDSLENYKGASRKYTWVYKTCLNWMKKEYGSGAVADNSKEREAWNMLQEAM